MQNAQLHCLGVAAVMIVACSGGRVVQRPALRNVVDGTPAARTGISLARVESERVCGGECEWRDGVPWSDELRAMADPLRDALFVAFVRAATSDVVVDINCAPNLAARVHETPHLPIYVKDGIPDRLLDASGLPFRRVSDEEFDRLARSRDVRVALLDIVILEPLAHAGAGAERAERVGLSYDCVNLTRPTEFRGEAAS
ncbi:MAG: hypothetical protein F9K40_19315 [Kofleriaceae bacterium]|nr:MAG: hypothetical protein F9K40_19315 [Kofleriaceae bacterium]MBZ0231528.1 hypothetical protein [Kofleriaceae bacterium]